MTRPRATTSAVDELGAVIADLKARIVRLEQQSHLHNTPSSDYVRRSGDTMTGNLTVPDATANGHAMNRQTSDGRYVNVTGDTMTGDLTVLDASAGGHALNRQTGDARYVNVTGDTMTGALAMPAGSAGAPSITQSGDTNTGVYFPAADTVGVATAGSLRLQVDSSGNVTMGRSQIAGGGPDAVWSEVSGNTARVSCGNLGAAAGLFEYNRASGQLLVRSGTAGGVILFDAGTAWFAVSDENLKNIVAPITDATATVRSLRPVRFTWRHDESDEVQVGLIAQDFLDTYPEAVKENDGTLMLSYTEVIPLLVAALQEQANLIADLETRIEARTSGN